MSRECTHVVVVSVGRYSRPGRALCGVLVPAPNVIWCTIGIASEREPSLWLEGDAICVACVRAYAKARQPAQLTLIPGGRS